MIHKFFHSLANNTQTFKKFLDETAARNNVKVLSFKETEKDPEGKYHLEFELDGDNAAIEKIAHDITSHYTEEGEKKSE